MEQGAKALLRILLAALAVGVLVIAIVPVYRDSARAFLRGEPEHAPIWKSNAGYYADVALPAEPAHDHR